MEIPDVRQITTPFPSNTLPPKKGLFIFHYAYFLKDDCFELNLPSKKKKKKKHTCYYSILLDRPTSIQCVFKTPPRFQTSINLSLLSRIVTSLCTATVVSNKDILQALKRKIPNKLCLCTNQKIHYLTQKRSILYSNVFIVAR